MLKFSKAELRMSTERSLKSPQAIVENANILKQYEKVIIHSQSKEGGEFCAPPSFYISTVWYKGK